MNLALTLPEMDWLRSITPLKFNQTYFDRIGEGLSEDSQGSQELCPCAESDHAVVFVLNHKKVRPRPINYY